MLAQLYLFGEDEASCVSKISCRNIIFTQHIEKPCTKPLQYIHLNEKFGGEKLITRTLCIFKI